jgi:hypothetical protein
LQISAAQRGLRVTFDLSEPATQNAGTDEELSLSFATSNPVENEEVLYNQQGQRVQRLLMDGVEVLVPLPSESIDSSLLIPQPVIEPLQPRKRRSQ